MGTFRKTIALLIVVILTLVGCTSATTPDEVVESFLNSIKKFKLTTASKYLKYYEGESKFQFETDQSEVMVKEIYKRTNYEIVSTEINENTTIVKTKIISPDNTWVSVNFSLAMFSNLFAGEGNADFGKQFKKIINDPELPFVTTEVDILLEKNLDNDKWLIRMDGKLGKALQGIVDEKE